MQTAVILHGMPSKEEYFRAGRPSPSNSHWLPWLQQQLIVGGVLAQTPELPEPYQPVYEKWRDVFERFPINEQTALVGHSCGAGFLVRWLSEHNVRVGAIVLVAPYLDPSGEGIESDFFRKLIIDEKLASKTNRLGIFYAKNDDEEILTSVKALTDAVTGIDVHALEQGGHLTYGQMGTDHFPELRDYVLGDTARA